MIAATPHPNRWDVSGCHCRCLGTCHPSNSRRYLRIWIHWSFINQNNFNSDFIYRWISSWNTDVSRHAKPVTLIPNSDARTQGVRDVVQTNVMRIHTTCVFFFFNSSLMSIMISCRWRFSFCSCWCLRASRKCAVISRNNCSIFHLS